MKKKRKKLTACALVAVLGLSFAVYPVYAQEEPATEQTDTGELLELDETAVPVENETAGSEPESTTIETEPVTQPETDVVEVPQSSIPEEVQEEQPESESPEFTSEPNISEDTEEFTDGTKQTEVEENVVPLADNTYNISENAVTIDAETNGECPGHTITGSSTSNSIKVTGGTHNITLVDCNIDTFWNPAFSIENDATVNLTLKETNTLKSGDNSAALQVSNNATLIITEESLGSLTATGGRYAAGIGGGNGGTGGTITINDGIITATGGENSSGIGGGNGNSVDTITINGGTVTATGGNSYGSHMYGIGGETSVGSFCTVTINGGNVTADSIFIPKDQNNTNTITFNGGTVTLDIYGSVYGIVMAQSVITGGSIKTKRYNVFGTDNQGNDVYLAKIDNLSDVNEVTVDGTKYTRDGDHSDGDGAFYLYLAEGQNHIIETPKGTYKTTDFDDWNDAFIVKQVSPTPSVTIDSSKTTASSITVNALAETEKYGTAEYSLTGTDWQDNNVFENLSANTEYTVYARYKGNDTYAESVAGTLNVSTNRASYTITIPADPNYPLEAGNADSISTISVNQDQPFDLGYNGQVDVKVKKDDKVTDTAELKLTRQNDTENQEITSALLVNGTALGNINTSVAIFKNKSDSSVSVSFEKPTEANIPAGTYNGTITFEVSYSE